MPTIKPINTTPGSTITAGDRAMMSIKKKLKAKAIDTMGSMGKGIMGAAKNVTHFAGGDKLSDFAGSKIAKAIAKPSDKKFVADKTSLKDAMKSAAKVAGTVGLGGVVGLASKFGSKAAGGAITGAVTSKLPKIGQEIKTKMNPFAKKLMDHNASIKAKLLKNKKATY